MVSAKQCSLIADFCCDEFPRHVEAEQRLIRQSELPLPQKDILKTQALGQPVEPAPIGEVRNWLFCPTESLYRRRGKLHIAENVHLRDFANAYFLDRLLAFSDLQNLPGFADSEAMTRNV